MIEYLERNRTLQRRLRMLVEGTYQKRGQAIGSRSHSWRTQTSAPRAECFSESRQRRVGTLADQLEALGWEPEEARDRQS